jgi:hypothetical protein
MSLANALHVHRFSGLAASGLSLTASLLVALAPRGWDLSELRSLCLGLAGLLGLGALVAMLVSAVSVLVVVAAAPSGIGVGHRFAVAVGGACGAAVVLVSGSDRWSGPGTGTLLVAGVLLLVALVAAVQVWTSLARHAGNFQLAEDLRNAFLVTITGAVLQRLASGSGEPLLMLVGVVALVPGAIMSFTAFGALARQYQYGAAWAT